MAEIIAEVKKIPPVTRFLVLSSLGVTIPAIIGVVSAYKLVFVTYLVTKRWEVSPMTFLRDGLCIANIFLVLENLHKLVFWK